MRRSVNASTAACVLYWRLASARKSDLVHGVAASILVCVSRAEYREGTAESQTEKVVGISLALSVMQARLTTPAEAFPIMIP
jgi:hypothetical protein